MGNIAREIPVNSGGGFILERIVVSAMEMANVMKTAMNLSELNEESSIMLDLQ